MNEIKMKVLEGKLTYKGVTILNYKIEYPMIIFSRYAYGKEVFNRYNRDIAYELESYCKGELYEQAKEVYDYNEQNGYPIMQFEVILDTKITLDEGHIVSLYQDQYIFTGGAHGSTIKAAQTWMLPLGRQMTLEEFYPENPNYVLDILREIMKQIQEQIEAGTGAYFEDYCQLVINTIQLENFYIIPNKTVIFFQQYDIAPYSSGIPIFEINRE